MKTLYTTYNNFAKRLVMSLMVLMTVGVGSVLGGVYTYDFSTTDSWYTTSAKTNNVSTGSDLTSFYDYNGIAWNVSDNPDRARFNTGYFILGKSNAYITLPTYENEKITSVVVTGSSGHSTSVSLNVYTTDGNAASTAQTWSTTGKDHTYAISEKYQLSVLRVQVTNAYRTQFTKIVINTEATASAYAITWNNGGHGTTPTSPTSASEVQLPTLTATGYTHTGWTADVAVKNGSNTIEAGDLINNATTVTLLQATTFTAQWSANKYTVNFTASPNGYGTVSQSKIDDVPHGTVVTSNSNTVTMNGTTVTANPAEKDANYSYSFNNWTGIPSGNNVTANCTITANFTRTDRALTNYRTSCTTETIVTLHANGGQGEETTIETINGILTLPVCPYIRTDYEFAGWSTTEDGEVAFSDEEEIADWDKSITDLYAIWCKPSWKLVTNVSELSIGDIIVIVAKESDYALSTTQNTYNRGRASISKKYNTIDFGDDVQKITLESGAIVNTFAFYTGAGYLYAAGANSNNYLKTQDENNVKGCWEISINPNVTAIAVTPSANITHNILKYNTSGLFSCYADGNSQKDVVIYKKYCNTTNTIYGVTSSLTNISADNDNPITVSESAPSLELKYMANAGYLLPSEIVVKMGGVVLTGGTDYTWDHETGTLIIHTDGFYGDIKVSMAATLDPCYTFTMSEVTATSTTNSITLTWTEVAGATGYKVRLDEGEFTIATGLTHTFEGLSPKTTYNWEVQAVSDICEASKTGSTATQKETFTVSWSVNGTVTSTEPVVDGESIQDTPPTPSDQTLEDCGANKFMGWSEKSAGFTPKDAAYYDDLCSAEDMIAKYPSITSSKTFYAVFATSEETTGGTVDASLSFANTAQRTSWSESQQVWTQNGVTLTNNRGGGTEIADNSNPARFYKNSEIIVEHTSGKITKIVFDCNTNDYATALKNSIGTISGATVSSSSDKVTVTFTNAVASFTVTLSSAQVRMDALTVTAGGGTITTYSNYVTNCCATPVPTNGSYTSVSGTEVQLKWNGSASRYHITCANPIIDAHTESTSYMVSSLTECEEYTFYVSADPKEGCESEAITITAQPFSGAKTVTFNYNGNGQANTTSSTSCGNTSITLPTPSWTGYRFMGWFNAASGGIKIGEAGASYKPTDDITLYAQWEKEYTVTYNANGGSTTCANGNYIEGETVIVCTTNPSRTGHTFTGWTYSPDVIITDGKFVMPASDVTITAQWQVNSYTVTWNPNGGNWGDNTDNTDNIVETYEYGATIVQPAAPQRDGYRFTGWNYSIPATMPAGNATYTAQWKQNYTITFYDGSDVTPWTQTKDAESINLTEYVGTLACDDYQFAGWSTADTKYNDEPANITTWVTGTYTPTANIHLYAVYVKGDLATDFTLNCDGGVYEIWEKGHNQHMAGRQNGGGDKFYTTEYWDANNSESNGAPFTITKVADQTYTLQNADGQYITRDSYYEDELEIEETWENADRYKWTISNGTNGTWRFTNKAATSYALVYYDNRYFELRSASSVTAGNTTTYDLELTPAASNVYQSNPNCGPYYIIFNTHGGEFIQGEYPYGEEKTGLTETTESKFPAAELEGYTFAGWKDGSPIDDEITSDNASDAPYLKQAGEDLIVSSNKTYHAVYYYYDEEEDIDFSKEFTTSIYAEVNGMKYFLAGTPSSGTMSSTTDCGYVSEVTITPGTGANAGKYKITVNGVAMAPKANETDLLNGTYWWTITERSVGSGEYKISGQDKKNIVLFNSSWGHYTYNQGSEYGNNYYYPRFGKCLQHHWTSNPTLKPSLNLSGEVYVTATNARGIMATSTLKVSAQQLNANEKVNITSNSNDVYFSADRTVNFVKANKPTNTLTITASPSGVIEQDIYVHYKPSAEGNGTPASVVVSANLATPNPSVTDDQTIYVRNLPAKFVIATKVGSHWYALPADMSAATNPEGVLIEVDETTMTATAPNTASYTLFPVKTTSTQYDRYTNVTGAAYGDRLRFSAVNNSYKGLWANNSKTDLTINNDMVIDQASDGQTGSDLANNSYYEWKVTTTVVDGHWQYTLQTDQTQNQNYLRYWTSASGAPKWGTYAAGNNQLYFLPVTETEPFDYKVVEWYPTKMLIQTDAAIANPTAKIGDEQFNDITCNNKGSKLYEIAGLPLESNPTKVLTIKFSDGGNNYTNATAIPVIISQSATTVSSAPFTTLTKDVYNNADLVVRDGATLTIDGGTHAENTFFNVTIYPTSKISVPDGKKLTVHSLTFFGGIDEIYNGSTYDLYKYGVPELSLKGTLYKSIAKMDYVMRVDLDQMYSLTVPYDVQLADIKYWDGSDIALGSALYVSAYDGEARANQSKKTWIYETDFESKLGAATLKAGVGYTISAELQAGVGNEYSILRMPMMSNVVNDDTETAKTVAVTAHGIDANVTDNHKGWNLVGNPYMTSISGGEADSKLVVGYLQETGTGPWEWVNNGIRYVTIPSDDGTYYWQQKFTTAKLPPFKNFFVQIGTTGELQFGLGTRQSMPARSTQAAIEKEVEFEILMSNDARQDNTGLLISEEYSPAYEINADLEKMIGSMSVYTIYGGYKLAYNALSPINASEWIPMGYIAPAAGEYTFRLDDVEKIAEQVEHVYVIDYDANNIVDLMTDEYKFTTNKEQNDNRFAINVVLIQDKDNTTTGLDIINGNNTAPIKFIYHDKIYIKSGEVIYDGTGKQVTNINK